MKIAIFDIAIIAVYFLVCLIIGLYKFHKIDTPKKFALGYSGCSGIMLTCILLASTIGAGTIFGQAEKLYLLGLAFLVAQLVQPIYWFIMAKIVGNNIDKFLGCVSVSEVMYRLYGSTGRWITTFVSLIHGVGMVAVQAFAIGSIFHYFLDIPLSYGIYISYGILTLYSMLGGVRAVAVTEMFQFFIFLFVIPVSFMVTIYYANGMDALLERLPLVNWGLQPNHENILLIASFIFYALMPNTDAPIIQRCLMASGSKQLVSSLKTAGCLAMPFTAFMCLIGYVISATSENVPLNELLLSYINNLPVGVKGLMISGVIAAIMGLAEGWLNSSSVILANDVLKFIFPKMSSKLVLLSMRLFIVILAVISINIAISASGIIELIWLVNNFSTPLILIPLMSGFLGLRTNYKSFVASATLAMISVTAGRLIADEFGTISLMFGIAGSGTGLFGMHYLQNMEKGKKLAFNLFQAKKIEHLKFCVFTFAYYFLYLFQINTKHTVVMMYLLGTGYLLCFAMLLKDMVCSQDFQKRYLRKYLYFTITFCNPCISTYMLLISDGNDFWMLNSILSCLSLIFFVNAFEFIIMLTAGVIFGFMIFIVTSSNVMLGHAFSTIGLGGYVYLFFLLIALALLRTKEKEQKEMLDKTRMFGGAIAHEVRSPIASMMMSLDAVNGVLNDALRKAKIDKKGNCMINLNKKDYEYLKANSNTLNTTGARAIGTVNHILTSLKTEIPVSEAAEYKAKELVAESIAEHLKCEGQRAGLRYDIRANVSEDFMIRCVPNYIQQVLLNLIKNAYHHGGPNVILKIWNEGNTLYVEDNGVGIPKNKLSSIFDSFVSTSSTGTGIGLSFCKNAVEAFGGEIDCKSEIGKYTRFVLRFPGSKNIHV